MDKGGNMAYVALGKEGCSAKNPIEIMACSIIKNILGAGSRIKGGASQSVLAKNIHESRPHALMAFSQCYYDSGIFGVLIIAPFDIMTPLVESTVLTLKTLRVSNADIEKGKNQLKTELICDLESAGNAIEFLGRYALLSQVIAPYQVEELIDCVSPDDVQLVLGKITSSPITIGGFGNLSRTPALDDIK